MEIGPSIKKLVDTHAHLHMNQFKHDFENVLSRTKNLFFVLNVSTNLNDIEPTIQIAKRLPNIYAAIGIHPHDSKEAAEQGKKYLDYIESKATHLNKVIAIGEIGLDYYRNISPVDVQKKVFAEQIALAQELGLPIILHIRDAYEDAYDIVKTFHSDNLRGIVHSFSSDENWAKKFVKLGFKIGIGGPVTYPKNEMLRNVVKIIGKENIVTETDCPYLPPQPFRGKRNEPVYVSYVYDELIKLLGTSVLEAIWKNVQEVFKIDLSDETEQNSGVESKC
ncbi:TatD family hydrolase [Fervidobacterium sp.]